MIWQPEKIGIGLADQFNCNGLSVVHFYLFDLANCHRGMFCLRNSVTKRVLDLAICNCDPVGCKCPFGTSVLNQPVEKHPKPDTQEDKRKWRDRNLVECDAKNSD